MREKTYLLDLLKEIDITNKIVQKIELNQATVNPLDYFFEILRIEINPLLRNDATYQHIQRAIQQGQGPTHDKYSLEVLDVLELKRFGEQLRYLPFSRLPNKRLLWHGSRSTNFVGILSEGLRVAPPDAPVSGYMFGKGIYFADIASKAANYIKATPDNS